MSTGLVTRRGVVDFGMRSALGGHGIRQAERLEALLDLDRCDVLLMDLLSCSDADFDRAVHLADQIPVVVLVEWDAPSRPPRSGQPGQLSLASGANTVNEFVTAVRGRYPWSEPEAAPRDRSWESTQP